MSGKASVDYFLAEALVVADQIKPLPKVGICCGCSRSEFARDALRLVTLVRAINNTLRCGKGLESLPEAWRPRVVGPKRGRRGRKV